MVVGVRRSLEEGRTYSYDELAERFGLAGEEFERVLDHLMEQGRLRPVLFERIAHAGTVRLSCVPAERSMRWQALMA